LLFAQRRLTTGVKQAIEDHLLPVAKRVLPPSVKTALTRRSVKLKNWASSSGTHLDLDWSRTRVFSRGKEGNIFVNLAGRDPHGIVNPDSEYGALLDEIETLLRGTSRWQRVPADADLLGPSRRFGTRSHRRLDQRAIYDDREERTRRRRLCRAQT
jgi:hypothetical protein